MQPRRRHLFKADESRPQAKHHSFFVSTIRSPHPCCTFAAGLGPRGGSGVLREQRAPPRRSRARRPLDRSAEGRVAAAQQVCAGRFDTGGCAGAACLLALVLVIVHVAFPCQRRGAENAGRGKLAPAPPLSPQPSSRGLPRRCSNAEHHRRGARRWQRLGPRLWRRAVRSGSPGRAGAALPLPLP